MRCIRPFIMTKVPRVDFGSVRSYSCALKNIHKTVAYNTNANIDRIGNCWSFPVSFWTFWRGRRPNEPLSCGQTTPRFCVVLACGSNDNNRLYRRTYINVYKSRTTSLSHGDHVTEIWRLRDQKRGEGSHCAYGSHKNSDRQTQWTGTAGSLTTFFDLPGDRMAEIRTKETRGREKWPRPRPKISPFPFGWDRSQSGLSVNVFGTGDWPDRRQIGFIFFSIKYKRNVHTQTWDAKTTEDVVRWSSLHFTNILKQIHFFSYETNANT